MQSNREKVRKLKLHHIGIAVKSIDEYYNSFMKPILGYNKISNIINNESQHSRIAFAENGQSVKIELIEAIDENSPTYSILQNGNGGFYHLGFVSEDFENDIKHLRKQKFMLISQKEGVAFLLAPTYEIYELLDKTEGW